MNSDSMYIAKTKPVSGRLSVVVRKVSLSAVESTEKYKQNATNRNDSVAFFVKRFDYGLPLSVFCVILYAISLQYGLC